MIAARSERADLIIVGAGIVGLATAHAYLERNPTKSVIVLEKESAVATHQSGHNSGVLHSVVYYRPGSRKAVNCRQGKALMETFCRKEGIPFEICGKVIAATNEEEEARLPALLDRGRKNGVHCELIGRERLSELEPACAGSETALADRARRDLALHLEEGLRKSAAETGAGDREASPRPCDRGRPSTSDRPKWRHDR